MVLLDGLFQYYVKAAVLLLSGLVGWMSGTELTHGLDPMAGVDPCVQLCVLYLHRAKLSGWQVSPWVWKFAIASLPPNLQTCGETHRPDDAVPQPSS